MIKQPTSSLNFGVSNKKLAIFSSNYTVKYNDNDKLFYEFGN